MKTYAQAKAEGLADYLAGAPPSANPYSPTQGLYMAWLRGWMGEKDSAAKEAEDMELVETNGFGRPSNRS